MFLSRGVWQTIEGLQDPDLKQLVSCLPDTLLNSSTTAKYMRAFMRWKTWAQPRREVTVFPIEEVHFAFYLQHLADTTKSKATVEEAVNAISWRHQLAGQTCRRCCIFSIVILFSSSSASLVGRRWMLA